MTRKSQSRTIRTQHRSPGQFNLENYKDSCNDHGSVKLDAIELNLHYSNAYNKYVMQNVKRISISHKRMKLLSYISCYVSLPML